MIFNENSQVLNEGLFSKIKGYVGCEWQAQG